MKNILLGLFIGLCFLETISQTDSVRGYISPQYIGGKKELFKYLQKYLDYPPMEREKGIEANLGAVIYISKEGKVKFVNVLGKEQEFKPEVKRTLRLMPDWKSGKLNGKAIDTSVVFSICYSIQRSRIKGDTNICEILTYSVSMDNVRESEDQKKLKQEKRKKYNEGKVLYESAVEEVNNNNLKHAIELFNQAEQNGYINMNLYYNRGVAYHNSRNKEFACNDFREAARMGSEEAYTLFLDTCKDK